MWDSAAGVVRLLDVDAHIAHAVDPVTGDTAYVPLSGRVTALIPTAQGGWLGIRGRSVVRVDMMDGSTETVVTLAGPKRLWLNDGVCGRDGCLYVGSVDRSGRYGAALYAVRPNLWVDTIVDGVGASNGLDSSADGAFLYHADTYRGVVTRYPDGRVINVDRPDGVAVDSEGCVWVALWGSGQVHRYRPDGALDRVIKVPAPLVTNVGFGGSALTSLFITTAASPDNDSAGRLFVLDAGVTGLQPAAFSGA